MEIGCFRKTHLPPPSCPDGSTQFTVGNSEANKHLVIIYHDECIFHANESQLVLGLKMVKFRFAPKHREEDLCSATLLQSMLGF